jgi:DNA repair protein RecO (recombination protein O)
MDGVYCASCTPQKKEATPPEIVHFLDWAKKNPPPKKGALPYAPVQLESIRKTLQSLIIYHLEKEPRSLHFLKNPPL